MRKLFNLIALVAITLVGVRCATDTTQDERVTRWEDDTLIASIGDQTRVQYGDEAGTDGFYVANWVLDDQIAVWQDDDVKTSYRCTDAATGKFNGSLAAGHSGQWAIYPERDCNSIVENGYPNEVLFNLLHLPSVQPSTQAQAKGGDGILMGKVNPTAHTVALKQVNAYIKFNITDADADDHIVSVTFEGNNNEVVAGDLYVDLICSTYNAPANGVLHTVSASTSTSAVTSTKVTYQDPTGAGLPAGVYKMAFAIPYTNGAPVAFANGFKVTFTNVAGKSCTKEVTTSKTFEVGKIYNAGHPVWPQDELTPEQKLINGWCFVGRLVSKTDWTRFAAGTYLNADYGAMSSLKNEHAGVGSGGHSRRDMHGIEWADTIRVSDLTITWTLEQSETDNTKYVIKSMNPDIVAGGSTDDPLAVYLKCTAGNEVNEAVFCEKSQASNVEVTRSEANDFTDPSGNLHKVYLITTTDTAGTARVLKTNANTDNNGQPYGMAFYKTNTQDTGGMDRYIELLPYKWEGTAVPTPWIRVSTTTVNNVLAAGETKTLTVTYGNLTVDAPSVTFTGCVTAASISGNTLTYTVDENTDETNERTGTIVVSADGVSVTINITQVKAKHQFAGTGFVKVTEAPTDWSGEYLIVYESSSTTGYVFNGNDANSDYVSATIDDTNNLITKTDALYKLRVIIVPYGSGYSIQMANDSPHANQYMGNGGTSNGITFSSTALVNTLSYNGTNSVITGAGGLKFQFNSDSGTTRFRYYKSIQQPIQLYKLVEGDDSGDTTTPTLTATQTIDAASEGGTTTCTISYTDLQDTDITVTVDGTVVSEASLSGTTITYTVSENETASARSGWIKLNATGVDEQTITINQAAATVTPDPVEGSVFQKVTSEQTDWSGEYLIVYEDSATNAHVWNDTDGTNDYIDATIVGGNTIVKTDALYAERVTIAKVSGGYSIYANDPQAYMSHSGDKNGLSLVSTATANTIEYDTTDNFVNIYIDTFLFRYNSTSGQDRFRYYKASTVTGSQSANYHGVQLYKLAEGSAPTTPSFSVAQTSIDVAATGGDFETSVTYSNLTDSDFTLTCTGCVSEAILVGNTIAYTVTANTDTTAKSGTIVVSATGVTASQTITINQAAAQSTGGDVTSDTWTLVTDASTLTAGTQIIIVEANGNTALSTTQNSSNRASCTITKSSDNQTLTEIGGSEIITLEDSGESAHPWLLKATTHSGYLYASSSSANQLKTEATAETTAHWSISVTSAGVATVKANQTNKNWLRKNSSSALFSCYASGQNDIAIYAK